MSKKKPGTLNLEFRRTIDASPKEVFDGWIKGTVPGPPWYRAAKYIHHPVKEGLLYFKVRGEQGGYAHYGRFLKIEKNKFIQQTWVSEFTYGMESVVTLSLKPAPGGKTALVLLHENLKDDEMGRAHEGGWDSCLGFLVKGFAKPKSGSKGSRKK